MTVDYTTYVYTPQIPLDVIVDLTKRAVRAAVGNSQLPVRLESSSLGSYQLTFKEDEGALRSRVLWLMTNIRRDFPSAESLHEEGMEEVDPRIGAVNDGIVLSLGSFGKSKEIMDEIGTALSFLGPVLHRDEGVDSETHFVTPKPLSLEEVMERYNFSLYEANSTLLALRRGGVTAYADLEAWTHDQAFESGREKRGMFAAARHEASSSLDM